MNCCLSQGDTILSQITLSIAKPSNFKVVSCFGIWEFQVLHMHTTCFQGGTPDTTHLWANRLEVVRKLLLETVLKVVVTTSVSVCLFHRRGKSVLLWRKWAFPDKCFVLWQEGELQRTLEEMGLAWQAD